MKSLGFRHLLKHINFKYLTIFLLLIGVSFYSRANSSYLLSLTKTILLSDLLLFFLTLVIFLITFLCKIRFREINFSSSNFKENVPEIINGITEPSTFICAFAVLKGLFLQYFFNEGYFPKFNSGELFFLLVASTTFFITSFIEVKDDFLRLFKNSNNVEKA